MVSKIFGYLDEVFLDVVERVLVVFEFVLLRTGLVGALRDV